MKLVGMFLFVLVAATVVVDVSASKASAKCEKKPGFYYGPDSKGKMKCIKACDAVKNEVVLFGQTFPCNSTTSLVLFNAASGVIPQSIIGLTKLTTLDLYNNKITGTIPSALGRLTKLNYLDLSKNELTGEDSQCLGSIDKVEFFAPRFQCT